MILSTGLIVCFYRSSSDAWLRHLLPLARETSGVRNVAGELRTNINRTAVLSIPSEKWVVAGPSYSMGIGFFAWEASGQSATIGSIGIGGQPFSHWARVPVVALQDSDVRRLYIACSPIGLMAPEPLGPGVPFMYDGADALNLIGIRSPSREYSAVLGEMVSPAQTAWDIVTLGINRPRYCQLRTTALTVVEAISDHILPPKPSPLREKDLIEAEHSVAALWQLAASAPSPVSDEQNGADARFNWNTRGVIEAVSAGGRTDLALGRLIDLARQRGVKVILFETPTLKNRPAIYPANYFTTYQHAITALAKRHSVDYVDLSGLLPEDGNSFSDFCHVRTELRPLILKTLLARTTSHGTPR